MNPPSNPTKTQSSKTGLRQRISTAQSIEELETLYKLSFAFKDASTKTIRQWKKVFDQRKQQLLSL